MSNYDKTRDALHTAFAIIANAQNCLGDGDPTLGPQWHEAAQRFIQDYNANLDVYTGYPVSTGLDALADDYQAVKSTIQRVRRRAEGPTEGGDS